MSHLSPSSSLTETGAVAAAELAVEATEQEESVYTAGTTDSCAGDDAGATAQPTRDALAEGLVGLVRPSLESLDESVAATRDAQAQLKDRIQSLETQLLQLQGSVTRSQAGLDLEAYIIKLTSSKKRILVVNSILQGAQVQYYFKKYSPFFNEDDEKASIS